MKILAISDTHNKLSSMNVGRADVIIHCGDAINNGTEQELIRFAEDFVSLDSDLKIFVPGNHDTHLIKRKRVKSIIEHYDIKVLDRESINIDGIKFYGIGWTRVFWPSFQDERSGDILNILNDIPGDTDILLTHHPKLNVLDRTFSDQNIGCKHLLKYMLESDIKIHIHGHIHEARGIHTVGELTTYNAASLFQGLKEPLEIDISKIRTR